MSTRLHAGLRLRDGSSDLFAVIPLVAAAVRRELTKASATLVGEELARACDDGPFRAEVAGAPSFRFAVELKWRAEQERWGRAHRLNDPLRFSMVFGRTAGGALLAYPFYEHRGYAGALKRTGLFEPYGYWNNSDRPRGTSQAAWDARGAEWEELTDENGTFGSLPLWHLGEESDPWRMVYLRPPKHQDLNRHRTQEARRRTALVNAVATPLLERYGKDNFMRALREADEAVAAFLATPEGQRLPLPELLPPSFVFRESDLPALYTVTEDTVQAILESQREINDGSS